MELLNEINGIVGRIHWIRLQKLAVLLAETGKLTTQKQQNALRWVLLIPTVKFDIAGGC